MTTLRIFAGTYNPGPELATSAISASIAWAKNPRIANTAKPL